MQSLENAPNERNVSLPLERNREEASEISRENEGDTRHKLHETPVEKARRIKWLKLVFGKPAKIEGDLLRARKMLGIEISDSDFADLTGAPGNATVTVSCDYKSKVVQLEVASHHFTNKYYTLSRNGSGQLYIEAHFSKNRGTDNPVELPPGYGAFSAAIQINAARQIGCVYIKHLAAGSWKTRKEFNGYYTWPIFGWDSKLEERHLSILPLPLKSSKTILDVLKTKYGADWWSRYGDMYLTYFDLREGSRSGNVFKQYMESKGYPLNRDEKNR